MNSPILHYDEENGLMITPLLDIIFLVLIFFALNLSFQSYRDLSVDVPDTNNIDSFADDKNFQLIEITQAGSIFLNKEKISMDQFLEKTGLILEDNPDEIFYIAAEDDAAYRLVMRILDQLTYLGIKKIHLISKEE